MYSVPITPVAASTRVSQPSLIMRQDFWDTLYKCTNRLKKPVDFSYLNLVSTCLPFLVPRVSYVLYQHSLYSVGPVDIGELLIPIIPRQLKFKGLGMEKIERKYARDEFG